MIVDTTQPAQTKRGNWVAAQSTCPNCGKIHDIMNFATADSFDGDCKACGAYVCTIVYGNMLKDCLAAGESDEERHS